MTNIAANLSLSAAKNKTNIQKLSINPTYNHVGQLYFLRSLYNRTPSIALDIEIKMFLLTKSEESQIKIEYPKSAEPSKEICNT